MVAVNLGLASMEVFFNEGSISHLTDAIDRKTVPQKAGRANFQGTTAYGECKTGHAVSFSSAARDESSWTALISQQTKCGQGKQALQAYDEMRLHGVKPSSYTFVAALKACGILRDLASSKRIHADVVKAGLQSNLYVGNTLLHVYAKCGSMLDARYAFDQMPRCNVVSWTAMVLGYAQTEDYREALRFYERMQQEGVAPNERTFLGALKACMTAVQEENGPDRMLLRNRYLEQVRTIHLDIVRGRFDCDIFIGAMLVDVYAKCGSLVDARHVFEKMPHHNVVSWTAMIFGYAQLEEGEEALRLYTRMRQEGVEPNDRTFVAALKACGTLAALETTAGMLVKTKCLEQVRAIHSDVVKSGSASSVFVGNKLVDAYSKCGSLADARLVFENMSQRNVVSWTSMILGCALLEKGQEALEVYNQMQRQGVLPNAQTFVALLRACSSLAAMEEGSTAGKVPVKQRCLEHVRAVHAQVVKNGCESVVVVGNMLVDVYAKCGSLMDARHVFEKMPCRSVVSWTAMIFGYAQVDECDIALELFARMQQEGVVPDDLTFVAALKACGGTAGLEKGKQIHSQILKSGLVATDPFLASSLIDMYGKCGSMVDAQQVFDNLPSRDIVIWNSLIAGYSRLGASVMVFDLFETMKQGGIRPDISTFLSVLTVCSHEGLVDIGQEYFMAISQDLGITPTIEHHTCMINLLGRSGQLDKAMALAQSMPYLPDGVVWRTILRSCQKWYQSGSGDTI